MLLLCNPVEIYVSESESESELTRQKNRLFGAALRSGASDSSAWSAYKKHKNLCNEQFQRARNAYLSTLHTNLANENNGSHRWWTKAKSLAIISTPRREVPDFKDPTTGELVTTDFAKANILGSYFSEQCTNQGGVVYRQKNFFLAVHNTPLPTPCPSTTMSERLSLFPNTIQASHFQRSVSYPSSASYNDCLHSSQLEICSSRINY